MWPSDPGRVKPGFLAPISAGRAKEDPQIPTRRKEEPPWNRE